MTEATLAGFERTAFRTLNAVVEPLVSAGVGGPLLTPFGAIVLETTGRNSSEARRTPLFASVANGIAIVCTYRGRRSHWVRNLLADPEASWWVNGARREGRAAVFAPDQALPEPEALPHWLDGCATTAWPALVARGWAVAVLVERAHSTVEG